MSLAKIKLDESSTRLDFDVSITGASGQPEARFIIDRGDLAVSFPCEMANESIIVDINSVGKIFAAGEYKARLEVIIENKLYKPMEDTIVFEPGVAITMAPKVTNVIKESVKISGVKVNVINEDLLRKAQAATIIAKSLHYIPEGNESPEEIIKNALASDKAMSKSQLTTLKEMLDLAEEVGVKVK